jgi:hypothetical protein
MAYRAQVRNRVPNHIRAADRASPVNFASPRRNSRFGHEGEGIFEGEAVGLDKNCGKLWVGLVSGARRECTHCIWTSSPATRAANAFNRQAQIRDSSSWLIHAALAPRRSPERLVQLPDTAPSVLIEYLLPKRRALNDLLDLQSGC